MRALSLFTGYAGIDLALKNYITEVVAYVEIDEYAQKIIANRMADGSIPRAAILGDVKNVSGEVGDCDIIYGGFPCQDLSNAGAGKGLAGERSGLFYEIIRLTKEIRPSFVFLENVAAIRARGLDQVIKEFTEIGYDCRWTCLSASSVGAPHKRERWFLLAHATGKGLPVGGQSGFTEGSEKEASGLEHQFKRCSETLPNTLCEGLEGQRKIAGGASQEQQDSSNDSWWAVEPSVGRVANGLAFRVDRIKALGNGVVPLQVKTAFEILVGMNYLIDEIADIIQICYKEL